MGRRGAAREVPVSVADKAILRGVPAGRGSGCSRGAPPAGGELRIRRQRTGHPRLPGLVLGTVATHPVAAEKASRGRPRASRHLADRLPQHVVLGRRRGFGTVAGRRREQRRGDRSHRHSTVVNDPGDHSSLATDRQPRAVPLVRPGRRGRRRAGQGGRSRSRHRRVPTVPTDRGADRSRVGRGGFDRRKDFPGLGSDGTVRARVRHRGVLREPGHVRTEPRDRDRARSATDRSGRTRRRSPVLRAPAPGRPTTDLFRSTSDRSSSDIGGGHIMTVIDTDSRKQVPATADTSRPLIGCPPGYQELTDWFTAKVARHINMAPEAIGLDTPLADYGLDSAASLQLCADLEYEKGIAVETTIMYDYATIDAIAEHLADPDASP
ncbi:hypothetical protein F6B93_10680 [Mycobacterium spongiae]|uniref:Carrier domain-containing protein n=2 Tax=Mycobacterium spongiae TaxID=886343 RepID=A0A975JXG8_9MYCO|nr:hypothetical protein F6B93_10680 [Mycobacterium spongiae]